MNGNFSVKENCNIAIEIYKYSYWALQSLLIKAPTITPDALLAAPQQVFVFVILM